MPQYRLGEPYARVLNRVVADGDFRSPEAVLRYLVETHATGLIQRQAVIIDPHAADNRARRTQSQWVGFFNEQGKAMISAPNIYQAGKHASDEVLASLRRDFGESLLVSSSRIKYAQDDLSGRITHNYESSVFKPSQRDVKVIPVYDETLLAQALQSDESIGYLHALFDTTDEPKCIAGTLENLSKRNADRIALWTPSQFSRQYYNEGAVRFDVDGGGGFRVVGGDRVVDGVGRSRGVNVKSAKPDAQK